MKIRRMRADDREAVEYICLNAAEPMDLGDEKLNRAFEASMLDCFCHYYVDHHPERSFVVAGEDDRPIGYIFCAWDYETWKKEFREDCLAEASPISQGVGNETIRSLGVFAENYPAHLHIDLLPQLQHQGYGTKLMDALCEDLRANQIPGIELGVAADNIDGRRFYEKYGFKVLAEGDREITMGLRL